MTFISLINSIIWQHYILKEILLFSFPLEEIRTFRNWWLMSESGMGRILSFVKFLLCLTCKYFFNLMTIFTLKVWIFEHSWKIITPVNESPYSLNPTTGGNWVVGNTRDGACAPGFTTFPASLPHSLTLLVCPLEEFEFEKLEYCRSSILFPTTPQQHTSALNYFLKYWQLWFRNLTCKFC